MYIYILLILFSFSGIWSQKMQLCLDGTWVLIMDYESGVSVYFQIRFVR